jgi:hypothetical protein
VYSTTQRPGQLTCAWLPSPYVYSTTQRPGQLTFPILILYTLCGSNTPLPMYLHPPPPRDQHSPPAATRPTRSRPRSRQVCNYGSWTKCRKRGQCVLSMYGTFYTNNYVYRDIQTYLQSILLLINISSIKSLYQHHNLQYRPKKFPMKYFLQCVQMSIWSFKSMHLDSNTQTDFLFFYHVVPGLISMWSCSGVEATSTGLTYMWPPGQRINDIWTDTYLVMRYWSLCDHVVAAQFPCGHAVAVWLQQLDWLPCCHVVKLWP